MTVTKLLRDMSDEFVSVMMHEYLKVGNGFLAGTYALIDEQSLSLKAFISIVGDQQGVDALIGAVVTLTFFNRRAELEEATRAWLSDGLFRRPDMFFRRQTLKLVTSPGEFQRRALQVIEENSAPFIAFIMTAADFHGEGFVTGSTAMVELLLRSEEYGQASLN